MPIYELVRTKPQFEWRFGYARKKYKRISWFWKLPEDQKHWIEQDSSFASKILTIRGQIWYLNVHVPQVHQWKLERAVMFGWRPSKTRVMKGINAHL